MFTFKFPVDIFKLILDYFCQIWQHAYDLNPYSEHGPMPELLLQNQDILCYMLITVDRLEQLMILALRFLSSATALPLDDISSISTSGV